MIPNKGTAIPRPDIGQAVYETMVNAPSMGFKADLVMPYKKVEAQTGTYPVIPASSLYNLHNTKRQAEGNYNRLREGFETGIYSTGEHGLEMPLDDRHIAMYGGLFPYEVACGNILMMDILRAREVRVAGLTFNESNFTSTAAAAKWSLITSDPKADVDAAKLRLRNKGIEANAMIVTFETFMNLTKVTKVIEAVKYLFPDTAKTGTIAIKHLEAYFGLRVILVGSLKNAAKKGQSVNLSGIWPDTHAMVARVADSSDVDIIEPCIGRTLFWNEGADEEVIVEEYYSDEVRGKVLRVRHDVVESLLASWNAEASTVLTELSKKAGELIKTIK